MLVFVICLYSIFNSNILKVAGVIAVGWIGYDIYQRNRTSSTTPIIQASEFKQEEAEQWNKAILDKQKAQQAQQLQYKKQ